MNKAIALALAALCLLFWAQRPVQGIGGSSELSSTRGFNLGPIGAEATVFPRLEEDSTEIDSTVPRPFLRVDVVDKKRPGHLAGLRVDDYITGVGGKRFKEDALHELSAAIEAVEAEAEGTAELELTIVRNADKGSRAEPETKTITVEIPSYGKPETEGLPSEALRKAVYEGALKWLRREQGAGGGYTSTMSPEVSTVVITSLAGLAFLSSGDTVADGRYSDEIVAAAGFVMEHVGEQRKYRKLNGKNNNQTNWSLAYGGIFLAHVYDSADPKWFKGTSLSGLKRKLGWVAKELAKQMEESGGYAHGPGGENILGYVEFSAVTNLCLTALGCIRNCGIKVDEEAIGRGIGYLESCIGVSGGMGYSKLLAGQPEAGRTAGALNAFAALGEPERESAPKLREYLKDNFSDPFACHSTPTMHVLSIGMACHREGKLDDYMKAIRHRFTMLRTPDHTFAALPTHESKQMGINIDRSIGTAWMTAQWAILLNLKAGHLSLWQTGKPRDKEEEEK